MTKHQPPAFSKPQKSSQDGLLLSEIQVEAIGRELSEPGWLIDERRSSLDQFRQRRMPSIKDIYWRRSGLIGYPFSNLNLETLAAFGKSKHLPSAWMHPAREEDLSGQLVFEDGILRVLHMEDEVRESGVVINSISQAARQYPDLVRDAVGGILPASEGKFEAFISSAFDSSYFLVIPKGVRLKKPLHTLLWSSGSGLRAWRLFVKVEEDAEVSLIHECASADRKEDAARLGMIELDVRPKARLNFFHIQCWGNNIVNVSMEKALVSDDAHLQWGFAHLGSGTTKQIAEIALRQPGASAQWTGCCLLGGSQHCDVSTYQNHLARNTKSDLLYKGALMDASRSDWQGMVRVDRGAAGSDGYQANHMLMLSEQAKAESFPGLEILSDDVRCSHGVSIGELDPEELFYVHSRGIPDREARRLLLEGFLEPMVNRFPQGKLSRHLRLVIAEKMKIMKAESDGIDTVDEARERLTETE